MNIDQPKCYLCHNVYNNFDRIPRIIISCGDTLCSSCIVRLLGNENSFECPFDKTKCLLFRKGIEAFPVNNALLDLLKKRETTDTCSEHNETMRLFCMDDKCRVCDECLSESHKGHHIKSIKKIKAEAVTESEELNNAWASIERCDKETRDLFVERKVKLLKTVQHRFGEFRKMVSQKEQDFSSEIGTLFEIEKNKVDAYMGNNSTLKDSIAARLEDLRSIVEKNEYSYAFVNPPSFPQFKEEEFQKQMESLRRSVRETSSSLALTLASRVESLANVEFPVQELAGSLGRIYPEHLRDDGIKLKTACLYKNNGGIRLEKKNRYVVISVNPKFSIGAGDTEDLLTGDKLQQETKVLLKMGKFEVSEENIRMLFVIWRKLGGLTWLKIDFSSQDASDDQLNKIIPVVFWKNAWLQRVEINLERCLISDRSLVPLFEEALPKMFSLISLSLNLRSTNITDKSLEVFSKCMQPILANLQIFKLSLGKTQVTDQGVSLLFTHMKTLKQILLDVEYTKITDQSLEVFAKNTLATAENLEDFELAVTDTKVTDKGVAMLFIEMPLIKNFFLSLGSTNVSDASIQNLVRTTIPSMKKVETLELFLWGTKVSDQSIEKLVFNTENLKRLCLYLGNTSVSNRSLQALGSKIMASLKMLESFELSVKNSCVTDEGIVSMLVNIKGVKKFLLNLENTSTTDRWIEGFVRNSLVRMQSLESFRIHLKATKITDKGILEIFRNLNNLSTLVVQLEDTKITDKSIEELIRNRKQILKRNFDELDINLSGTGVSDKIRAEVANIKKMM